MFRFLNCLVLVLGLWCVPGVALADTAECMNRFPAIYAPHAKSWCADYAECRVNQGLQERLRCCSDVYKSVERELVGISSLCRLPSMANFSSCKDYPIHVLDQVERANRDGNSKCMESNED